MIVLHYLFEAIESNGGGGVQADGTYTDVGGGLLVTA